MRIVTFVNETKEAVIEKLLEVSGTGTCQRRLVPFSAGEADVAVIRGGAIEKACITHLTMNGIKPPGTEEPIDYMVFQAEIFPENPRCPMGHLNTEWSLAGPGPYHMNLDLFPAITPSDAVIAARLAMDGVAEAHGIDRDAMRQGLDEHYNMAHWPAPLASNTGCKLLDLQDDRVDLFIAAYHTFFGAFTDILDATKDAPVTESDTALKHRRNGRWLEYITIKDPAVKMGLAAGLPPEVLIDLSYPPSATF